MTDVLAMPMFDPGAGRVAQTLPEGLTVAEIVSMALPGLPRDQWRRLRIALADTHGHVENLANCFWERIRPHPRVRVIVRVVPAGDSLKSVLLTVVSIAAVALGQFWAVPLANALGATAFTGLIAAGLTIGITALGTLLVNALIPSRPDLANGRDAEKPTYAIAAWRNQANPGGVIAAPLGYHRQAPNFFLLPYSEIVGAEQYIRAGLLIGYGPNKVRNIKIGETPIEEFDDVEYELREGYADDAPLTICPQQVLEESVGVELRRDFPRDGSGTPQTGVTPDMAPIVRYTARDITEAAVVIGFPAGLIRFDDKGDPLQQSVSIRIRQRMLPAGGWVDVTTLNLTGKQSEGFFRQHRWNVGVRGRYAIEMTRITSERLETNQSDRTVFSSLQSIRPEYPINFDKPLTVMSIRIRASHQLNGTLDTINLEVSRVCPDWDHETQSWITRETRNPASLYRWILQGPAATFPEPDANLDLVQLAEWHDFCRLKGLAYERLHDHESSQWDALADVAAAGRATPNHDGRKWGVVIDRSGELIVDHISTANSHSFTWSRTYFEPPHAFRVSFLDRTNDYGNAEMIIPWPGHAGDVTVTEQISMPGKTDPVEIWIEGRRRQYELMHRPDRITVVQAGAARRATRGDRIRGAFPSIDDAQDPHRVRQVIGDLVRLDGLVEMEVGKSYGCRYRVFDEDDVMSSIVRPVVTVPGQTDILQLAGVGPTPPVDEWLHFGILGHEDMDLIVAGVEAGEDMSSILTLVAEASQIDDLVDAEVPPLWDGRVGGAIDDDTTAPAKAIVQSVQLQADGFTVLLAPGGTRITVASFAVRHRLVGSGVWLGPVIEAAGAGAVTIGGYAPDDDIEWQAQSISINGVGSLYSDLVVSTVPTPIGAPDPFVTVSVTAGLGHASLVLATPADPRIRTANIYRNATATFGTATLVASLNGVLPSASYGHVDGDATRTNMLANPGLDSGASWSLGAGWSVAGGKAIKVAGAATAIGQALALIDGKTYRYRVLLGDRTAGSLSIELDGGTDVVGAVESSNGAKLGAMTALVGNTSLAFSADAAFDGSVDDVVLFEQTPTSLPQGTHYYFITAANEDGDESAPLILGPYTIT